jgi:hypothetical protein
MSFSGAYHSVYTKIQAMEERHASTTVCKRHKVFDGHLVAFCVHFPQSIYSRMYQELFGCFPGLESKADMRAHAARCTQ